MFSRFPTRRLILPSALAALACVLGSALLPWDWWESFLQNLSTTFIGILLAALYVDVVQRDHEEQQWQRVKTLVRGRLRGVSHDVIYAIIFSTAKYVHIIPEEQYDKPFWDTKGFIEPLISSMSTEDINELTTRLQVTRNQISTTIDLYGRFLSTSLFETVMQLEADLQYLEDTQIHLPSLFSRHAETTQSRHPQNDIGASLIKSILASSSKIAKELEETK